MGSSGSKAGADSALAATGAVGGPRRKPDPNLARRWRYLKAPSYAFMIGGPSATEGPGLRFPTSVAAFHGVSLTYVPNDTDAATRLKQHREAWATAKEMESERQHKERAQHAVLQAKGDKSKRRVFGREDTPWPHVDDLRFVVTDRSNHRVVLMDEKGHVVHTVGSGEAGIKQGEFADPRGLCWDQRNKRVLVTDNDLLHLGAPRWQALTYHLATEKTPGSLEYDAAWANGERVEQLAREQGKPLPQMRKPWGVAVGVKGSNVLVSDNELHCIHVFNESNGEMVYETQFGTRGNGPGELFGPRGIAVDSVNNIIVADCNNDRVQVFTPDARPIGCITGLDMPSDVAVDPLDNIIVADTGSHSIKVFTMTGEPVVEYGGRKTMGEPGYFASPMGVDIAVRFRMKDGLKRWGEAPKGTKVKADDDRVLVVADTGNHAIQVLTVWQQDPAEVDARFAEAAARHAATKAKEQQSRQKARDELRKRNTEQKQKATKKGKGKDKKDGAKSS